MRIELIFDSHAFWRSGDDILLCSGVIKKLEPKTANVRKLTLRVETEPFTNSQEFLIWYDAADWHYHYKTKDGKGYFLMKMNQIISDRLFNSTYSDKPLAVYVGIELT